ncbi:MAG TPA: hypothetical protein PK530_06550, partial [Anaerolineales bacterium]|nr:hypothetical protein [Anaerolineales bacterium]
MFRGSMNSLSRRLPFQRGLAWGALIVVALVFFEMFNYSTTDFALHDLLGDLEFIGLRWSTILALAFCGIDFAGIARIFTPEEGADEPAEVWYLFAAWLLAATMNAILTWWGVSIAILNNQSLGSAVVAQETLLKAVPIFVAVLVWLSRVLLIGTFSVAGDRLFSQARGLRPVAKQPAPMAQAHAPARFQPNNARPLQMGSAQQAQPQRQPSAPQQTPAHAAGQTGGFRPAPKPKPIPRSEPTYEPYESVFTRPEPNYHPVSMSGRSG